MTGNSYETRGGPYSFQSLADTKEASQALLDAVAVMNHACPAAIEIGAGDFYISPTEWNGLSSVPARQQYVWDSGAELTTEWNNAYKAIAHANLVLESTAGMTQDDVVRVMRAKALFYRSFHLYWVSQLFAPAWPRYRDWETDRKSVV